MASFRERLSAVFGVEAALLSACGRFWARSSVMEWGGAELLTLRELASGLPMCGEDVQAKKAGGANSKAQNALVLAPRQ
jgi:hypothetical protein